MLARDNAGAKRGAFETTVGKVTDIMGGAINEALKQYPPKNNPSNTPTIADISSDTFKKIDDILEIFVYDKDTVDSNKVKVEFQKEGLDDIIQKYLDENPYVDKSVFGL